MKTAKQTKREAKQLFRLCIVNGRVDEGRVRKVVGECPAIQASRLSGLTGIFSALVEAGPCPAYSRR